MKPLKVSEVNNYIKRLFIRDMILTQIDVEGEISNFKYHYSGHMYFTLKDNSSKIRCVMFRDDNLKLNMDLEEGMNIVASGYISIYEKEGSYQLYIKYIKELGVGDLYKKFDLLKRKLEKEGMFNKEKKQLPFMPKNIGVATSSSGAAIRDIINVIRRRNPAINIFIYPVAVQGENAPSQIRKGLEYLDNCDFIDLIITGRGGGSIEELFAFNDEELARCIYKLKTPIISAVGHETDFTIADFVSDMRAPTPSAAAEIAVPNMRHLYESLYDKFSVLNSLMTNRISIEKNSLEMLGKYIEYSNPTISILNKKQNLDYLLKDLNDSLDKRLDAENNKLKNFKSNLEIYDKYISLENGFGIIYNNDNKTIKSIDDINLKDDLSILLKDGILEVIVSKINKRGEEDGR